MRQIEGKLEFSNADPDFVEHYFGLDEDLQKIACSINKDDHIAQALGAYWGLRLIRQDPWECLISYICATYKNIPAIRHMLNNLAKMFGRKIVFEGCEFYGFPECDRLATASEKELKSCGLGYRAKYVQATSKLICNGGFDLESLKHQSYADAKQRLMDFPGVGAKVADCVLLFSLGKTEAFPVDRWVMRVLSNHYAVKLPLDLVKRMQNRQSLSNTDYERLNSWSRGYFGEYAGYAQEYLYHFERTMI